ncbi:hypothetical protein [uncultured Gammaproteobacteria bacterium]|nr:hypothetical protein BROOK1789C_219 [Bathymodiolus brooksi thiotrophic gill symbiont]CAC9599025.1 hypothetical protein [uncultured Gammaproteobacteria bacterium]CAC9604130.1 hypothetical protein [uncultured Gammaproteobacteria bacterium]CAC9627174.1 hypothetical protein [uncultured Gammaproteobacteria bacterium]CAC9629673.1 hypothetical protein [uncultured Gammaproteobacteria bacterium]
MKKTILFLTINIIFLATNYLLAQTCQAYIPNEWEDNRYTNHGNGTVTDNQTNLMWKKCTQGRSGNNCDTGELSDYNWEKALQLVNNYSFASYDDWRLPNAKELTSLVSYKCVLPSINKNIFPNTPLGYFWTSSLSVEHSGKAWLLFFKYGGNQEDNRHLRSSNHYVRLVRSGQ